jgi:hypothetical protein
MSNGDSQQGWVDAGFKLVFPPPMHLAAGGRSRHFKALERFVNCGDSVEDYTAFGKAFLKFWPVRVYWFEEGEDADPWWRPEAHDLFTYYRDVLRGLWRPDGTSEDPRHNKAPRRLQAEDAKYLLGIGSINLQIIKIIRDRKDVAWPAKVGFMSATVRLTNAWRVLLNAFPKANTTIPNDPSFDWRTGRVTYLPDTDFQRAFYLLFQQSWRARVCERCGLYFIAQKPSQRFCSTACSAGNRLASKLKWWRRVGAKRRAQSAKKQKRGSRKETKRGKPRRR